MNSAELARMAWTQIWQLTALIAVVAVIVRLMAKRRPHLAYVLWLVVLAKCLTPPIMASPGGIFCWLQPTRSTLVVLKKASSQPAWLESISMSGAGHLALSAAENELLDGNTAQAGTPATPSEAAAFDHVELPGHALARNFDSRSGASSFVASLGLRRALTCAGVFWLAGSIALAVVAAVRLVYCIRGIHRSGSECPADLAALVADLAQRLAVRRPVRLIVSASRVGPVVLGLLRPTIVLPAVVVRGKSPRELEPILAHELLHVRRGDLWTGVWQVAAQAVWWFHPLVWLANRLATRAAEACCDEEAIAELGCDPERYAESLLAVLEQRRGLVSIPAFPGIRPVDVTRERLERIMQLGQGCRTRTPWWCWLVMGAAAGVVLPGAALVGTAEEQPAASSDQEQASPESVGSAAKAREISRTDELPRKDDRQSAAQEIVTVNVANDPGALRPGENIDLVLIDLRHTPKPKRDPRVVVENLDPAIDPPTYEEVVRALPVDPKGNYADLADVARNIVKINIELIASHVGDSRFYPMIGPARLRREHFKCTVRFDKFVRSNWPIPFKSTSETASVVYLDKDHLILNDGAQGNGKPCVVTTETVQVESVAPRNPAKESHEIRVAVSAAQAMSLKAATAAGHLVFFQSATREPKAPENRLRAESAADVGQVSNLSELRINLLPNAATHVNEQAIQASAGQIIESGVVQRKGAIRKAIALRKNAVIVMPDGSTRMSADNAVIDIQYRSTSGETVERLTVTLSGDVGWKSPGLDASAANVIAEWRLPDSQGEPSPGLKMLRLDGSVSLNAAEFAAQKISARADRILVEFAATNAVSARQADDPVRLVLDGRARMSRAAIPTGARSSIEADRIEFSPQRNELKLEGVGRIEDGTGQTLVADFGSAFAAAKDAAAEFRADDGGHKKPPELAPHELVTLTYSVADLVVPVEHAYVNMSEDGAATAKETRRGAQDLFTELIDLIQSTVSPESWETLSGPGSMIPYRTTLSLVVRQTHGVHDEIADLLGQLRRLRDLQCSLQFEVISISGGTAKTASKLDNDQADSNGAATNFTETQLKAFRETIALMEKADSAAAMGGFKLMLFNGQGAELKLRRRLLSKGTAPLPALHVVPVVAADRTAIRLQLAVGASKPLDAMARAQGYIIKKDESLLLDITEERLWNNLAALVGAQPGAVRRQHKIAPAERVFLLITPQIVEIEEKEERLGVDVPARAPLSAIVIEGNKSIETRQIMDLIKTQTGRPLDPKQVREDVRSLVSRRWFHNVETRVSQSNNGPVLIFRVTEKGDQPREP